MSQEPPARDKKPFRPFQGLPLANPPTYPVGGLDDPIPLYEGEIELACGPITTRGEGHIRLDWFPTPRIAFDLKVPSESILGDPFGDAGDVTLKLADGRGPFHGDVSNWGFKSHEPGVQDLSGTVECPERPASSQRFVRLTFLLPNFLEVHGAAIRYSDTRSRRGRIELSSGDWKIVIDAIDHPKGFWKSLERNRGFAITHTGLIERVDGSGFVWDEVRPILGGLRWFLSWASGRWTGPVLSCGEDTDGKWAFERWDANRIVPAHRGMSWFDQLHDDQLIGSFPGFQRLWIDENWNEVLRLAVHWYVEANAQAGSVEGSIVLTQTAFEMLAFKVLVAEDRWISKEAFEPDGLAAVDRVRLLLVWAGIPRDIPDSQMALRKLAKAKNWTDIPHALVSIRNPLSHPTGKNLDRFRDYPPQAVFEAWNLGLWCLELILLKLCGYYGDYACRLESRYAGEVRKVPYGP